MIKNVALVKKIFRKIRPAQERHSVAYALGHRIPTTMAEEDGNGR